MVKSRKRKYGFTLIELLIVVAIIAILAAIAIPNFLAAQVRSKVSRSKADMRTIAVALESYCVDYDKYPIDSWNWNATYTWMPCQYGIQLYICLTTPVAYMTSVPKDILALHSTEYFSNPLNQVYNIWYPTTKYGTALYNYDGWTRQGVTFLWQLWSWGPSRTYRGDHYSPITGSYDPSNGTISNGCIMRWGP